MTRTELSEANAKFFPQDMEVFENEDELDDSYPIYADYIYVADGKLYRSDYHGITARDLKRREGFKSVRRCNIAARRAARGLTP